MTYNKLLYNSMQLHTAVVSSTMRQQLVNTQFLHSELGIRALRWCLSWYCIHPMNTGIRVALMTRRTIVDASWILWMLADKILKPCISYAEEWQNGEGSIR